MTAPDIDDLKRRYPGAETFTFGDGPDLCAALLDLVRAGKKVATCGAIRDFEAGEPLPMVGRRDIALRWDGTPALVIETRELVRCRFDELTEAMALAEGEDETLDGWRRGHRDFFARNGGYSPDMPLLWERFELIEDLG
ncbi:ASCH domain-containing protein [Mesobaculum littorinae]|uniref:ASCH domain-containing protein n=1 Tax=Mesobaculum littorinae TaxID=2486419 RepID=A0A438AJL3_9RHOB|nr:ASCH domain-containing protein [Mesobaculum littorinae]RVV98836.1 ASCH domain-containing protein [Mesobaculum littorinae]